MKNENWKTWNEKQMMKNIEWKMINLELNPKKEKKEKWRKKICNV